MHKRPFLAEVLRRTFLAPLLIVFVLWPCVGSAQEAGQPETIGVRDLEREIYQVSYIEAKLCLDILKALGYTVGPPTGPVPRDATPIIFHLPDTAADTVVGELIKKGEADRLNPTTDSSPQQRLMILYRGDQLAELIDLRDLLTYEIDVPGRQVLIEATVIELSEDALRELGFEYDYISGHLRLKFEETSGGKGLFTGTLVKNGIVDARLLSATLKAVIDKRMGEVLSSPSILTLDNRQARISIIEDIPIIESSTVTGGTVQVKVRFEKVGITLNIKPRVSSDGAWVTMQIKTEVGEAPLEDFITIGGEPVAPVINRRQVETIARIRNNTPFIIGGLIRKEKSATQQRIPIISAIPVLGNLFKIRSDRMIRREVIIVLTPRVLEPESPHRPVLPKDTKRFDFLDTRLFRNSYRLKAEDVFDLGFVMRNDRVGGIIRRARAYLERHPQRRFDPLFSQFGTGRIPGEQVFVIRMIYEIIQELAVHEDVAPERIIFFSPDKTKPAGFRVEWLKKVFARRQGEDETHPLERPYPKDVLLLRYRRSREEGVKELLAEQVADWEWVRVEGREEAEKLLYDYSRAEGWVRDKAAVLLADRKDLVRLQTAVALRETVNVNSFGDVLNLENFQVGRRIVMPELDPGGERHFLIEFDVADYFFQSDFYYETFQDIFRHSYEGIRDVLEREGQ